MPPNIEHALPAGHVLQRYRIAKLMGGGGFSLVYLAHDVTTERAVVIKEYLPSNQAKRGEDHTVESLSAETSNSFKLGIKRFFDEAALLARVKHPSIVQVIDFFRENNTVYLVMNHEDGKDLRWYLKRHGGRLSEKFIRTVFPQLLLGLQELHANNLLHLDIKPANIFLRPGGRPLLIDFGATQPAYVNDRPLGPHTLTPGYAPIEQHRRGHLGPWSDLYALGASIWTCMNGKAPPTALKRAEKDTYKRATRAFAGLYTPPLLEAVDWCMEMDPFKRPQTAQALLDVFNQLPVTTPPEPAGLFTRLWLKKEN